MPMTQSDIRAHYETEWGARNEAAETEADLAYADVVQDAVAFPAYLALLADLGLRLDAARVLDVGSGSGRWIRFLLEAGPPAALTGVDFAQSSIDLLRRWHAPSRDSVSFEVADITAPDLAMEGPFDLVNVANVLFHVPEADKFDRALRNLARLAGADGCIVTTEYLPRISMRTEWMLVRSRYEFEAAARAAGLRIAAIRPISFFATDPMGVDGPDHGGREHFQAVRTKMQALLHSNLDGAVKEFVASIMIDVERAALAYAGERVAAVDHPGQKLVVLRPAASTA